MPIFRYLDLGRPPLAYSCLNWTTYFMLWAIDIAKMTGYYLFSRRFK